MALLYSLLDVDGRLKYVRTQQDARDFPGRQVGYLRLLELADDHDLNTEMDLLLSHLPGYVAGLGGESNDGVSWVISIERWSADYPTTPEYGISHTGFEALDRHLHRALDLASACTGTLAVPLRAGMSPEFMAYLGEQSDDRITSSGWSFTDQLRALATEACGYSLSRLAANADGGCAFPDEQHDCTGDIFTDVFQGWIDHRVKPGDEFNPSALWDSEG